MSYTNVTQHGTAYHYGFTVTDAPNIGTGFVARTADLKLQGEIEKTAENGEGLADSVTITNSNMQMINASFTGYIVDGFVMDTFPLTFSWQPPDMSASRFFVRTGISEPKKKGDYTEVTIEAKSWPLITA